MTFDSCPVALLESLRNAASDQTVLLVADTEPTPSLDWLTRKMTSTDLLEKQETISPHSIGLIISPWVHAEHLDAVIACLRDLLTKELYVLHPGTPAEQARKMGALGLKCLQTQEHDGILWGIHHYNLRTYKETPRWLNNRFWANPHLWNKFRW